MCKVKLLISRPINWQWYGFVTLSLLGMAAVGRLLKSYIVWVISSRKVWMGITIVRVLNFLLDLFFMKTLLTLTTSIY